jgi:putative NADPH-quinone reductase
MYIYFNYIFNSYDLSMCRFVKYWMSLPALLRWLEDV